MWNVEILSIESITPSSPSAHPATLKLSYLDELQPRFYVLLVLFYSSHTSSNQTQKSQHLRTSLSKTLTHFYPLAGRIKQNTYIDCNDSGADFVEARVEGQLSEFLTNPDIKAISRFLPCDARSSRSGRDVLLAIQANFFTCGGIAIGIGVSHKIADACSLATFVNGWAATSRGSSEIDAPTFDSAVHFPPLEVPQPEPTEFIVVEDNLVTKRVIFDAPKIAALRTGRKTTSPTRVEAVSVLIWRCMMRSRGEEAGARASVALQAVNLRPRMAPPLPEHSFGNLLSGALVEMDGEECESDTQSFLEKKMRDAIEKVDGDFISRRQGPARLEVSSEEFRALGEKYSEFGYDLCVFSSWCRFGLYEADFGWGRPAWASQGKIQMRNSVVLMGTRSGDGIEAWVCLDSEQMGRFVNDKELLSFAYIPSIEVT